MSDNSHSRTARISRRREHGFTLLEVLAAFVVLALVMAVLMRLLAISSRNSALSADYAQATRHAENLLAQTELAQELLPGTTQGAIGDRRRWRRVVTLYQAPGRDFRSQLKLSPMHVEVEVTRTRGGHQRSVNLSTLRLAKTP